MSSQESLSIEPFSDRYDLVQGAEIHQHSGDKAEMDLELFYDLAEIFGDSFIGMVEGVHYEFMPQERIPFGSVAIPEENVSADPSALLILK